MYFPRPWHPQPVRSRRRNARQSPANPHRLLEGFIRFRNRVPTLPNSDNEPRIDQPGELVTRPSRAQEFVSGGETAEPIHIIDNVHPAKIPGWQCSPAPTGQICGELGLWKTFGSALLPQASGVLIPVKSPKSRKRPVLRRQCRKNLGIRARHSWISDARRRRLGAEAGWRLGRRSGVQRGVQDDAGTGAGQHLDSPGARIAPEHQVRQPRQFGGLDHPGLLGSGPL